MIVCTAPQAKTAEALIGGLAILGKLLMVAVIAEPMTISPLQLLGKKLSVLVSL